MSKNPYNITIHIEDPRIDSRHMRVFCRRMHYGNQFIVKDLSNHDNPDTSGIWVQLGDKEVDLLEYDYMEREFSVLNNKYMFKFEKKKGMFINDLEVWMKQNELFWAISEFEKQRIESLNELDEFDIDKMIGKHTLEHLKMLREAISSELRDRAKNLAKRM